MNNKAEDPNLWNDAQEAQKLMRERQQLEDNVKGVRQLETQLADNIELIAMGEEEGDQSVVAEAEEALRALKAESGRLQVEAMLSGEADGNDTYLEVHSGARMHFEIGVVAVGFDTYLEVHSGAGGTESQDWANMLLRMYSRWAEKQGFKTELLEIHDG